MAQQLGVLAAGFSSQHPHSSSEQAVALVSGNPLSYLAFMDTACIGCPAVHTGKPLYKHFFLIIK